MQSNHQSSRSVNLTGITVITAVLLAVTSYTLASSSCLFAAVTWALLNTLRTLLAALGPSESSYLVDAPSFMRHVLQLVASAYPLLQTIAR